MPKKLAVLGGGPASMAAIYYILDSHNWDRDAVDITVYQLGWRLGGKCASGRNMTHNARVEEHGIHFWFGSYHNSFRWIEDCYPRLKEATGYAPYDWKNAMHAAPSYVGFTELTDGWDAWEIRPPAFDQNPATQIIPKGQREDFMDYIGNYVIRALEATIKSIESHQEQLKKADITIHGIHINLEKLVADLKKANQILKKMAENHNFKKDHPLVAGLVNDVTAILKFSGDILYDVLEEHESLRRIFTLIDLMCCSLNGMIRDDVFHSGFEVINDIDFLAWMRKNGMSEITLESTLLRSYYDGAFAFRRGDKNQPSSEAGTTLMGIYFALFTDDGSMFWKFNGSMAEIIFTPYYLLLKEYGVKFKFFHKVKELKLSDDGKNVGEIVIGRQVNLKDGAMDYDPLVEVKGIKCWPSEPKFELIKEGEEIQRKRDAGHNVNLESFWTEWQDVEEISLKLGSDYDELIFGIPVGSVPYLCTELIEARREWQDMVHHLETVATQSVQVWTSRSATDIGWNFPNSTIYTTYAEPMDTWCANPELVPVEDWPKGNEAKDVFFFTGSLPDPGQIPPPSFHKYPGIMKMKVAEKFMQYLIDNADVPFPQMKPSVDSDEWFNWGLLMDPENRTGMDRLRWQFFRANVDPSERYVLSVPDSSRFRLSADGSGFENLYLTGDWIVTPLNSGCFEAAMMAGLLTARAVTGKDVSILGEFAFKKHPDNHT